MCWRVRNVKRYRLNPTNWQLESICQTLYTQQVWSIWIVKKNLPGNVKRLHFHQLFMTLLYNTFCDTGVPRKNMWKCLGDNGKSGGNTQEDLFTEMRVFFFWPMRFSSFLKKEITTYRHAITLLRLRTILGLKGSSSYKFQMVNTIANKTMLETAVERLPFLAFSTATSSLGLE